MRRKPAEIVKLPGIAAAILPANLRTFVVIKLATDVRRDFLFMVTRTLRRALHRPLHIGTRRSLVSAIPELGASFDDQQPGGEENAETLKR